jgi:hypothetical protein
MIRLGFRGPGGTQVFEQHFDALDRQANATAAGKQQQDIAFGRLVASTVELDRQQLQHLLLGLEVNALQLGRLDPLDPDR